MVHECSVDRTERLHNQPKNPLNKKFSENWKLKIENWENQKNRNSSSFFSFENSSRTKLKTIHKNVTRDKIYAPPIPPGSPWLPLASPGPPDAQAATTAPSHRIASLSSKQDFRFSISLSNSLFARRHRPKNRRMREVFQKWADASTTDYTFNCKLYSYNYIYNCSWVTTAISISCRSLSSLPLRHIISLTVLLLMPCASSWHRLTCSAYCTSFVLCKLFTKLTIYPHCQSLYLTLPNHCIPFTLLTHSDKLRTLI